MHRPHFTPGKDPILILQEVGWTPGPVWTYGKSRPHRDSIPDRPALARLLYRLSYPVHRYCIIIIMNIRRGSNFYERKFFHELVILLVSLPTELSYLQMDLSYNALSFLHEEVTRWDSLDSANLQGNPWDCTCRLQWVLERVLPLMYNSSQGLLYELRLVRILNMVKFRRKNSEPSVHVIVF